MPLVFRPFTGGDVVTIGDTTGHVLEIPLFTTLLDTPDNRRIITPNRSVFGAQTDDSDLEGWDSRPPCRLRGVLVPGNLGGGGVLFSLSESW